MALVLVGVVIQVPESLFVLIPAAVVAVSWEIWESSDSREERRNVSASRANLAEAENRLVNSLASQYGGIVGTGDASQTDVHLPAQGGREEGGADRPAGENLTLSYQWATTNARLKLYHDVALGQANRSFRSAHAAMWLGFLALGLFVGVAFKASTTASSIVAGGLGAVAAGLAGFIGRTFVRSQEHAAEHLRSYFDQPLEMARYLAAERLIADTKLSDEQRAEVLTAIVTAMVAGPQPQPAQPPQPTQPQQTPLR